MLYNLRVIRNCRLLTVMGIGNARDNVNNLTGDYCRGNWLEKIVSIYEWKYGNISRIKDAYLRLYDLVWYNNRCGCLNILRVYWDVFFLDDSVKLSYRTLISIMF